MDPGDGSGTWHAVNAADVTYREFNADGTLTLTPYNRNGADHYRILSDSTMFFITTSATVLMRYSFLISSLIIYPPCYEGCGEKYIAVH
jgi:hypothetical protein